MFRQGKQMLHNSLRSFSTSLRTRTNHYDVLGLTPKSSQNEIKSAYYKLSKVYHPDKSPDEASAKKFRAITEAYEVLGNVKLKNLYDKGLLVERDPLSGANRMRQTREEEPTDPSLKFHKSRTHRHAVPTIDGRRPIFDFDAWAKNHYSNLYVKSQYEKEFIKQRRRKQEEAVVAHRQETVMLILFILGGMFIYFIVQGTTDYDKDQTTKRKEGEEIESAKT